MSKKMSTYIVVVAVILLVVLGLKFVVFTTKIEVINNAQLETLKTQWVEPKVSHWLYKGTEDGYHFLSHVDTPGSVEYKILTSELSIEDQFALTPDSSKWRLMPWNVNTTNKQVSDNNQNSTTKIITEKVVEFETPAKYQLTIPAGYTISELPPPGTDFLVGAAYLNCIHKEQEVAQVSTCAIKISSGPEKFLLDSSLEGDLKKELGSSVIGYNKTSLAGNDAYEATFKLDGRRGYLVEVLRPNHRFYIITALLNKDVSSVAEAKAALSEQQKSVIESFKFVD